MPRLVLLTNILVKTTFIMERSLSDTFYLLIFPEVFVKYSVSIAISLRQNIWMTFSLENCKTYKLVKKFYTLAH